MEKILESGNKGEGMTKTIWKYVFDMEKGHLQKFGMSPGGNVVRVAMQNGSICIWVCLVPDEFKIKVRQFYFTGTGHKVPLQDAYIGSCTDGPFEWHVWEHRDK